MPATIGEFISDSGSRKPDVDSGFESTDRNTGGTGNPEIINGFEDPATERIPSGSGGSTGKRRGRPPGSGKRGNAGTGSGAGSPETDSQGLLRDGISLEKVLYSLHLMGAEFLALKELELEKDECKRLSDAIAEVNKFYALKFDLKKVAIFNLCVVAAGIYGPMGVEIKRRLDRERTAGGGPTPVPDKPKSQPTRPPASKTGIDFATVSPSQVFGDQTGAL